MLVCKEHLAVQAWLPEEADAMFVVPVDDSLQGFHVLQSQLAHIRHPFLLEGHQPHVPVTHTTHPVCNHSPQHFVDLQEHGMSGDTCLRDA